MDTEVETDALSRFSRLAIYADTQSIWHWAGSDGRPEPNGRNCSCISAFTPHWGGGLGVWLFGGDEETPRLRALREYAL